MKVEGRGVSNSLHGSGKGSLQRKTRETGLQVRDYEFKASPLLRHVLSSSNIQLFRFRHRQREGSSMTGVLPSWREEKGS